MEDVRAKATIVTDVSSVFLRTRNFGTEFFVLWVNIYTSRLLFSLYLRKNLNKLDTMHYFPIIWRIFKMHI